MKHPSIIKSITLKQFQALEIILDNTDSDYFHGELYKALKELKEMFSYSDYIDFKNSVEATK